MTDGKRILVLSDAHFGTAESSINTPAYASALVEHIARGAPWEEIVLTGDLLDVNLSTFTESIEGGEYPDAPIRLFGFRQFVDALHASMHGRDPSKGLADVAGRWVYVPGNHDYKIWDMLATKVVCEDVLRDGRPMGAVATPLRRHTWRGLESFFAGIFKRYGAHDRVVVTYPNHEAVIAGELAVFTHGHYLDRSQTWRNDLHTEIAAATSAEDRARRIRRIFIETAQYQTAANAASFTKSTRRFFHALFGPEGIASTSDKVLVALGAWILRLLFLGEAPRGRRISDELLLNIESYLTHFCELPKMPAWFVFGHTHRQDAARTPNLDIEVYNAGSFYPDRGMPMTFLEIDAPPVAAPSFRLMCVNGSGAVEQVHPARSRSSSCQRE
jgi:UDP-2,3-diacylglucosamine pyrophosphatase LpxH